MNDVTFGVAEQRKVSIVENSHCLFQQKKESPVEDKYRSYIQHKKWDIGNLSVHFAIGSKQLTNNNCCTLEDHILRCLLGDPFCWNAICPFVPSTWRLMIIWFFFAWELWEFGMVFVVSIEFQTSVILLVDLRGFSGLEIAILADDTWQLFMWHLGTT